MELNNHKSNHQLYQLSIVTVNEYRWSSTDLCTMYTVHRTLYIDMYITMTVRCIVYYGQCTLYTVHRTSYTVHRTPYTDMYTVYISMTVRWCIVYYGQCSVYNKHKCIILKSYLDLPVAKCGYNALQCTIYSVQCIVYSVQCTVYSVHYPQHRDNVHKPILLG